MKWFLGICGGVAFVAFLWELFDKRLRKLCPKHKAPLEDGECLVRYGLIRMPAYFKAKPDLFPWANSFVLAGCKIPEDREKTRKTRFCPVCRKAESEWKEEHEKKDTQQPN